MKLYLAGPIRGFEDTAQETFHISALDLVGRGHEVFNPARDGTPVITNDDLRPVLASDLNWLCLSAEGIALLRGWEKSKGAVAEYHTAVALGLIVLVQTEFGWRPMKTRTRRAKP